MHGNSNKKKDMTMLVVTSLGFVNTPKSGPYRRKKEEEEKKIIHI